ncbi:hypothetical protein M8C21_029099 [Ambrosia artemisiifolia]|uniref:CCT domain-containing protein n=1 Tax=Ambrosia artemisiifolia TaxID=4212 RepID=A0AAD5D6L3_AMBAR|nr:hypothetical protein M8C21_029099 [Ambrosia artemisiifolia]
MFIPENTGFLVRRPIMEKPGSGFGSYPVRSPPDFDYRNFDSESNSMEFDTESMLDEEIGEGIDSIMGISHSTTENYETKNDYYSNSDSKTCYGYPIGLGFGGNSEFNFGIGIGMRNGIRALRNCDGGNWRSFPTVNVVNLSPPVTAKKIPVEKKKKRVEELMKKPELESELELERNSGEGCKMLLKLNYDDVLKAWSEKGSPLPEEISGSESPGGDIHSKLAQIDLFSENDGLKEVGVVRYKEKKHTRLFSKKIKYHVRKINAERRPKSEGRFVRRPSSPTSEDS